MKVFKKIKGYIYSVTDKYYILRVDGEQITIAKSVMHKMVEFPKNCMDEDSLRNNIEIDLMRITEDGNVSYYPDHSVYELKQEQSLAPEKLLENLEELSISPDNYLEKLSEKLPEMKSEERLHILQLFEKRDDSQVKDELMRLLGSTSCLPNEDEDVEYKSSLFHCAQGSKYSKERNGQLMEIIMSVAAIANTARRGVVYVGIKDKQKHYEAAGIEEEIARQYPSMTLDQYTNTVITNFIRTYTQSDVFLQGLKFRWMRYQGHLVLRIDIDFKGDLVLCNSSNSPYIPYRVGSSTHCVYGYGLIDYIRNHPNIINN